jgi:hypothetical protein
MPSANPLIVFEPHHQVFAVPTALPNFGWRDNFDVFLDLEGDP